jgi:hypothetical protein
MPEEYFKDKRKNFVMFLHGMPDFVFMQEHEKHDKAFSLIKNSYDQIPNCYNYIGMWDAHKDYWDHLLPGRLINTNCWTDLRRIAKKSDVNFDKNHIKLVCFDTWRGHKEPYWVINAVKTLIRRYETGKIPFKVTLDIYGQDVQTIPSVWIALTQEYLNKYIYFRGYSEPQEIFDNYDIALTQVVEETRIVRESLLSGIPLIVGDESAPFTDYKAGFRNVTNYANVLEKCCYDICDDKKRKAIHEKNRNYAIANYDVTKNAEPIFECFERIYAESKNREKTPELLKKSYNISFNDNEEVVDEFKTKVLICSIKDIKIFEDKKNIDKYYLPYEDVVVLNDDKDYVQGYKINKGKFPKKYFNHIYIDYLDIMPEEQKKEMISFLEDISIDKKIVKGEINEIELNNKPA